MIIAALSSFGINSGTVWYFGVGVLAVYVTIALVIMGVLLMKSLIDQ